MKLYALTMTSAGVDGAPFVALFWEPPTPQLIVAAMKRHPVFKEAPITTVVLDDLAKFPVPEALLDFFAEWPTSALDWRSKDGSAHYALQLAEPT